MSYTAYRDVKVLWIKTNTTDQTYGPNNDLLSSEVVVKFKDRNGKPLKGAFGLRLRPGDPQLGASLAMLSILKEAFVSELTLFIRADLVGSENGYLKELTIARSGNELPKYI